MKIQNVKGSMDYLPEEQLLRNKVISILSKNFENYGYLPVETTTLCYYDLLASKYAGGAEILKEVYRLNDQGDRELALRYDLTVPFSKIIALNKGMNLPFRRYEIGKVYRAGPVKVGRNREFYQCDVDVCGIEGQAIEAELFQMAFNTYQELGIDIEIEWNNRKFLSGIIMECGISEELVSKVILSVDKLAKIGEDGVRRELKDYQIDDGQLDRLFEYFKLDISTLENIHVQNDELKKGIEEIRSLNDILVKLNLVHAKFTPYLARGLEIYTGTVWEVFDRSSTVTCAIGAGGRYDNIITNFIHDGSSYPAVGMSFGLVPIVEILKKKEIERPVLYQLYLIPMGEDSMAKTLELAQCFRKENVRVIVEMNSRKVKKCFEWANKQRIPFVSVIGDEEIRDGKFMVKDMNLGTSDTYSFDSLEEVISRVRSS